MAAYIDKSDQPAADEDVVSPPAYRPGEKVPLAYAMREVKPPIDWWAAVRQMIFAFGAAFVAGGAVDCFGGSYEVWNDDQVLWIAFGVGMMTLVIPWPGGFRRVRSESR